MALVLVVTLAGCGTDTEETAVAEPDPFAPQEVSLGWPHCSEYADLQDAVIGFRDAEAALDDAGGALEGAEDTYHKALTRDDPVRIADARAARDAALDVLNTTSQGLLDALDVLAEAELAAVATAETIVVDVSLDDDIRYAAQAAVEAYAAARDAARYVASGEETLAGFDTAAYRSAYEAAEAAAWATAEDSRATAELVLAAARDRLTTVEAAAAAATEAVVSAEGSVREKQNTLSDATTSAAGVANVVRAEVESAAADARTEARAPIDEQIRILELVVLIREAASLGETAESASREAAIEDGTRYYLDAGGDEPWGTLVGELVAGPAAWMAFASLSAALATRLDRLAAEAGLESDLTRRADDHISALIESWAEAEDFDWSERVDPAISSTYAAIADQAALFVFDRQESYDKARYQQFIEGLRKAVAESVPASMAVAAAEAEEQLWAEGSNAWEAYTLAQDRLRRASVRGRYPARTDGIAASALIEALDALRNEATAKATSLRDSPVEVPGFSPRDIANKINTDSRVVEAQAAVAQARNQLDGAAAQLEDAQNRARRARTEVAQASQELARAQTQLDATRPDYTTALAAALLATGQHADCR